MEKALNHNHEIQRAPAFDIDQTDRLIIEQLVTSPNISNVELASRINTSASTAANRLQNLFDHNIIKIIARLDTKILGYNRLGMVRIDQPNDALINAMQQLPNILIATKASAAPRVFAIIAFSDYNLLRKELYALLAEHAPNTTCSINECTEILKYDFNTAAFDDTHSPLTTLKRGIEGCDDTDYKILSRITLDARQSNRQIAREIGVSENTVRKRISALIDKQLIKIGAVVDNHRLYSNHLIFEGEVKVPPRRYEEVVHSLYQRRGVYFLAHSTGANNLVFTVAFRDQQELKLFSDELDQKAAEKSLHLVHPIPEIFRHEFLVIN